MFKSAHFAHPDSPMAAELGCPEGCWYVRTDDEENGSTVSQPFATIKEAEDHAELQPGKWSRWYVANPPEGSRFYSHIARWADTHEARVEQWRAIVARREARKRPTLAVLRKGWFGSQAPRYVAEFSDGTVTRVSFWQAKGKPYDFARGRKVAIGSSGKSIVRGFVEHDIPGEPWVRIEDPMTENRPKVRKPSCRKVLERIIAAINNDNLAELKAAYNDALEAVAA